MTVLFVRLVRLFADTHPFGTAYGIYYAVLRERTHFVCSHSPNMQKNPPKDGGFVYGALGEIVR